MQQEEQFNWEEGAPAGDEQAAEPEPEVEAAQPVEAAPAGR